MLFAIAASFIRGCIKLEVSEGFADKFVALCHEKKVPLNNVEIKKNCVVFETEQKFLNEINASAAETGMLVTRLQERGLPFLLRRMKQRFGLPLGMVFAAVVFCIISSVVWSVEIKGCEQIDVNFIYDILFDLGAKRGAFINNIDCKAISDVLEGSDSRIYSTAVNIEGCKVFVGIKEKTLPEAIVGTDVYSNIVARYAGEITETDIYAGEGQVKAGHSVVRGDLLVSGVQNGKNGELILTDSEADIRARTSHVISCDASGEHSINRIKKIKDCYAVYFFGLCFLSDKEPEGGSVSLNEYFADTPSTVFPVGIVRQRQTFFENVPIEFSSETSKLICLYDLALSTVEQIGEKQVLEYRINFASDKNARLEAEYICMENISEKKYFQVVK